MNTSKTDKKISWIPLLWTATVILLLALMFARAAFPDLLWLTVVLAVLLVASLAGLVHQNRKALRSRSVAFGVNSFITAVLVIAIVGVLNFLVERHPLKLDLTKNRVHTLSEQTTKVVKELGRDVKAVYFAKLAQREEVRSLLDNYESLNPKFEVEYVDPDKEPTRAKQADIKKYGTLQLIVGERTTLVDEVNEEKLTNSLIKLLKDKAQIICTLTGHGEKDFDAQTAESYSVAKKALEDQAYQVRSLNLVEQQGRIPDDCTALMILGPTKAFFEAETKALRDYLAAGGRAVVAVDPNLDGGIRAEYAPELNAILADWHVKPVAALGVDPLSRMLGVDAAVPIVAQYSKDHPITRDFQMNSFFPFTRPLETVGGAPAGLNATWIARTTPKSWGETDIKELKTGQVQQNPSDIQGPLTVGVAVEGKLKDSKAERNTRLVVFGSSAFANNHYVRFGGNLDLFMNAASWILEDESLISIRARDEEAGRVELTAQQSNVIALITVIVVPLLTAIAGVVVWARRRKL